MNKFKVRNTFAVDVGLNAIGWAAWREREVMRTKGLVPDEAGVIDFSRDRLFLKMPWHDRAARMFDKIVCETNLSARMNIIHAVEWPEFRAGSAVGHAAASGDSLSYLAMMCGQHLRYAFLMKQVFMPIPVSEWKGQLPKPIVQRRLEVLFGGDETLLGQQIVTHGWDAVGIGLHAMGWSINRSKM